MITSRVGHTSKSFTPDKYGHMLKGADEGLAVRLNERIRQAMGGGKAASSGEAAHHFAGEIEARWRASNKKAPSRGL